MKAQVLNVKLKKDASSDVKDLIEEWVNSRGMPLDGCKSIISCYEIEGRDRCTIIVLFDDSNALDEFSNDTKSLDIFENAKEYADDRLYYYPANVEFVDLT